MTSVETAPSVLSSREPTILLVGDGVAGGDMLADALSFGGYRVLHAPTGHAARMMLRASRPDLVVLELVLPDADGLVLLDDLRHVIRAPVLVCSTTRRRQDRILALRLGADDFLAQPISGEELRTCVRALLGRAPAARTRPDAPELLRAGELEIDQARRSVSVAGEPLQLTPTEYRLVCALASALGQVRTHDDLLRLVWQYPDGSRAKHVMHAQISRLRAKLQCRRPAAPAIVAVRGFGYMLEITEAAEATARSSATRRT